MAQEFKIVNLSGFLASLRQAQKLCSDLTEPLTSIGKDWMKANEALFTSSGPGTFADLSGASRRDKRGRFQSSDKGGYKAQKLKRWGFVYPIGRASGAFERSITVPGDPGSLFEIENGRTLVLGTKVVSPTGAPYPKFLNDGTVKMPARRFLVIPQVNLARWKKTLRDYVVSRAASTQAA